MKPGFLVGLIALAACSTTHPVVKTEAQKPTTDTVAQNNDLAERNDASYFTELSYKKKSSRLNTQKQEALKDLVQKSMKEGKIEEIKVLSWADQEYPRRKTELSKHQRSLADRRSKKIENYLHQMYPNVEISTYNMAQRPEAIESYFRSADDKTKRSFERAGILTPGQKEANYSEKKSKTLIMTILK